MTQALGAGPAPTRRRALFGLLDADGWGWASVKAFLWFLLIIFMIGYIPDRAYYFTVGRTLDLGILAFSPVNFCPPENETLPCPAPQGAVLPWHPSPAELSLPAARTDGALVQVGTKILFIGGSDGTTATDEVLVAQAVGSGNFDRWTQGPALPEPRADAAVAFFGGSIYVVGGYGADGAPTTSTYILTPDATTGDLGTWQDAADADLPLDLPDGRAGSGLVPLADGLLLVGGANADGATATTWKSALVSGALTEWQPQAELRVGVTDAVAVQNGDYVWVYGGTDAGGQAIGAVQRGTIGTGEDDEGRLVEWGVRPVGNLPEARTTPAGWAANGALYLVGGSDGTRPRSELYWVTPTTDRELGDIVTDWKHLAPSDLPAQGLAGAASLVSGPNAFLVGGETADGPIAAAARSNLAPQEPFFRAGLLGAVVPALKIDGEVGQQLGYLNANGIGIANFAILLAIGWAYAHREQTRRLWNRITRRG
jgi:N-acetylneuraminic acid mutarotase